MKYNKQYFLEQKHLLANKQNKEGFELETALVIAIFLALATVLSLSGKMIFELLFVW